MQERVKKPKLPIKAHEKMRIAGKLVDGEERIEVRNPYTGAVVGTVAAASPAQVAEAFSIGNAYKSKLTRYDRQKILTNTAEILSQRREEIAHLITAESGLCLKDSLYEVGRAYDVYLLAGQMAIRDDSEVYSCDITPHGKARRIYTSRTPVLGCISAITPFNHPLNMISHKIAPAIATNNRVVAKPTELTPLTALLLADILYEAGLPPQMLSIVTGNPRTMGDAMITDPHADIVTFTGSVKVGKYIAEKAGYKRLVLELGGNDPLIVMEDADLDKAAELAVQGATKNSGQRCTAVKRILVVESVADKFVEVVLAKAKKLKSGDPMDPDTDIGTVIHERAARTFEARVNDAVEKGARLLHGNDRKGALYPATVVDHVPYTCELVREETFGPVIPIIRCPDDIAEVIRISNATAYGLSSGVCTNRLDYITRFVNELEVGTVNIWEVPGYRIEMSPFGGIKDFRARLQGRRVGSHEELHQRQDLLAALAGLIGCRSVRHRSQGSCFMFAKWLKAAAAGALLMGALAVPAAAQKTKLTVYTALENDQLAPFKAEIEKAVADVEVEWVRDSTGVITARFLAEKDNPRADMVLGLAASSLLLFKKAGLLEAYQPKGVDALKPAFRSDRRHLDRPGRVPRRRLLQHGRGPEGRPAAAQVLEGPDRRQVQGQAGDAASGLVRHRLPDGRRLDPADGRGGGVEVHGRPAPEHGRLYPLRQRALRAGRQGRARRPASRFDMRGAREKTAGAPIEVISPVEGVGWDMEAFAIVKGTKKADAAKKVADWAVTKAANELYSKYYAIVAHPDVKNTPKNYPADAEARMAKVDFQKMADDRERTLAEWSKRYELKAAPKN